MPPAAPVVFVKPEGILRMLLNTANYADFQAIVAIKGRPTAVYSYLDTVNAPQAWWVYATYDDVDAVTTCISGAAVTPPATFATDFPGAIALTGPLSIIP